MKHIIRIDASCIKESSCLRRLVLITHDGYTGVKESIDLFYGSSFHRVVETHELTDHNDTKAIEEGLAFWDRGQENRSLFIPDNKQHLNKAHLFFSAQRYCQEFKQKDIFRDCNVIKIHGDVLVEKKFSIIIYEDEQFIVLLQGTIDKLVLMLKTGALAVADWKTTSSWEPDKYFSSYSMSPQLRVYALALKKLMLLHPDREFAKQLKDRKITAFIYGAFLKSPMGVEFHRSPIYSFSDNDLQKFEKMLMKLVHELIAATKLLIDTGIYPEPTGILNGSCVTTYGGLCKYFKACSSMVGLNNSTSADRLFKGILESEYIKREYRPLSFGGEGKV